MKYYKVKIYSPFCGVYEQFVVAGENITSEDVESYIQDDYEQFIYDIGIDDKYVDSDLNEDEYYNIYEQIESDCMHEIDEIGENEANLFEIHTINK